MPIHFNMLLQDEGIAPAHVRLLRHQTSVAGRTPYSLWRDRPDLFEAYQRTQDPERRAWFRQPYWASFVATPSGSTLFAGLYSARLAGPVPEGYIDPITGEPPGHRKGRVYDIYDCALAPELAAFAGRLHIEWGRGTRTWSQRADQSDKVILELNRVLEEEAFPGFTRFVANLSEIEAMPIGWKEALRSSRGVYLLACPKTREHYVGQAGGEDGFLGRWRQYVTSGHGGNVGLRLRDPSDYQVSVLEVVGTNDIGCLGEIEALWKRKLMSRDMGLNRN